MKLRDSLQRPLRITSALGFMFSPVGAHLALSTHQVKWHDPALVGRVAPATPRRVHRPAPLISAAIMRMVFKVHMCESPASWSTDGPTYFGGLGWTVASWLAFRAPSFPRNMADATPEQQGWAMAHFVAFYHIAWPHQGYPAYCGAGY